MWHEKEKVYNFYPGNNSSLEIYIYIYTYIYIYIYIYYIYAVFRVSILATILFSILNMINDLSYVYDNLY